MELQQIETKITHVIAPDRVDVVGVVLGVVVFEKESRSLHTVVVRFPFLDTAGPGENDLVLPSLADLGEFSRAASAYRSSLRLLDSADAHVEK